jgi:hypothetical protein
LLKPAPLTSAPKNHSLSIPTTSNRRNLELHIKNCIPAKRYNVPIAKKPHTDPNSTPSSFLKSAWECLKFTIDNSYSESTNTGHSYAIKCFLTFAAKCGVAEADALPCIPELLCMWIADGIGCTGVRTATSNIAALSAWHQSCGLPFEVPLQTKAIKHVLKLHWPEEKQQKPPHPPISPKMVRLLTLAWSSGSTHEKCALVIAVAAFIGQMRLGELLPASADKVVRGHLITRGKWSLHAESRCSSSIGNSSHGQKPQERRAP